MGGKGYKKSGQNVQKTKLCKSHQRASQPQHIAFCGSEGRYSAGRAKGGIWLAAPALQPEEAVRMQCAHFGVYREVNTTVHEWSM